MGKSIKIELGEKDIDRVERAFSSAYGYVEVDDKGNPNPVSRSEFMEGKLLEFIKGVVVSQEVQVAFDLAKAEVEKNPIDVKKTLAVAAELDPIADPSPIEGVK
jgi:hypothetical protein